MRERVSEKERDGQMVPRQTNRMDIFFSDEEVDGFVAILDWAGGEGGLIAFRHVTFFFLLLQGNIERFEESDLDCWKMCWK